MRLPLLLAPALVPALALLACSSERARPTPATASAPAPAASPQPIPPQEEPDVVALAGDLPGKWVPLERFHDQPAWVRHCGKSETMMQIPEAPSRVLTLDHDGKTQVLRLVGATALSDRTHEIRLRADGVERKLTIRGNEEGWRFEMEGLPADAPLWARTEDLGAVPLVIPAEPCLAGERKPPVLPEAIAGLWTELQVKEGRLLSLQGCGRSLRYVAEDGGFPRQIRDEAPRVFDQFIQEIRPRGPEAWRLVLPDPYTLAESTVDLRIAPSVSMHKALQQAGIQTALLVESAEKPPLFVREADAAALPSGCPETP